MTVPSLAVMETVTALARHDALARVSDFEAYVADFRILPLDEEFVRRFIAATRTSPLALKTSDAVMVRAAQWTSATLITLDQQMIVQSAHLVRALTPQQYLELS
ncbi:MAG: PIN domain-containing protein [Patescibacteria group bacterium]